MPRRSNEEGIHTPDYFPVLIMSVIDIDTKIQTASNSPVSEILWRTFLTSRNNVLLTMFSEIRELAQCSLFKSFYLRNLLSEK